MTSITCPQCGNTSCNQDDIRNRYCGKCHQIHDAMTPPFDPKRYLAEQIDEWEVKGYSPDAVRRGIEAAHRPDADS